MATRTLTGSAEELLYRNRLRKSFVIQNEDSSIAVYAKRMRQGAANVSSTDHDILIPAGGSLAVNSFIDGKEAVQDRWDVIPASGTPRVAYFETEDQER